LINHNLLKICYIHQYFRLSTESGSHRSYYFAKALAENGYQVTVITAHNSKKTYIKEIEGFSIIYLPVFYCQNLSFWGRIWAFLKFVWLTLYYFYSLRKKIDVIYATSTPLSIGLIALIIKFLYKISYIFEIRDLWPEVPIQMRIIKNRFFKRFLYFFEKKVYQNALKIVALSEDIKEYISKKVPNKNIVCITNFADADVFKYFPQKYKSPQIVNLFSTQNIDIQDDIKNNDFVILYAGAMGKANGLEFILQTAMAAQKSNSHKNIVFLMVGEGSEKNNLENFARQNNLENLFFIPSVTKELVANLLAFSDAFFVCFADYQVLSTGSPNKFFDGLASGRLCIHNTNSWIKTAVAESNCGFYVATPEDFLTQIKPYFIDNELLRTSQNNAFLLSQSYSNLQATEAFLVLFQDV
jgi:glycosyltransferase involved in cell wall biosynthesis